MTTTYNEIIFQNGDKIILGTNGCHTWVGAYANTVGCWFRKYSMQGVSDSELFNHIISNHNGLVTITYA
jgi:hypothetical protein